MDSSQEPTTLTLAPSTPFPVTIVSVLKSAGSTVAKHETILSYKYVQTVKPDPPADGDTDASDLTPRLVEYVNTFESPVAGKLTSVDIKPGVTITSSSEPVARVLEPCAHPVQYGGMCAVCGENVADETDYSGFTYTARAPIAMAHDSADLKVSVSEAARIEKKREESLIRDRKLVLVVDLDQTIIHATVDPTVGEWMKDPSGPNYGAIKNVRKFTLGEKTPGTNELCWYYIKLRPGVTEFLESVSQLYELHIYTMATRSYATEIARIVDPQGKFFGDRILSRNESGSLTEKFLARLFPIDTSMVVIIDDRGDVWKWSPNLIKVVPYDFFVGIGDINSGFLPRQDVLLGPTRGRRSIAALQQKRAEEASRRQSVADSGPQKRKTSNGDDSAPEDLKRLRREAETVNESAVTDEEAEPEAEPKAEAKAEVKTESDAKTANSATESDTEAESEESGSSKRRRSVSVATALETDDLLEDAEMPAIDFNSLEGTDELLDLQTSQRKKIIVSQQTDRPLAQLQKNLDRLVEEEESPEAAQTTEKESRLLTDDDTELYCLEKALRRIHAEFYRKYEEMNGGNPNAGAENIPDVKQIIPAMKREVLGGYVLLFSGLLPLGTDLHSAGIVRWTTSFGAEVETKVTPRVTHVVCTNGGTAKVKLAKLKIPGVKIVHPDWLFACMSNWEKVPEDEFAVEVPDTRLDGLGDVESLVDEGFGFNDGFSLTEGLDWNDVNKELDEFLGSDGDDDDDDDDDDDEEKEKAEAKAEEKEGPEEEKQKKTIGENDEDSTTQEAGDVLGAEGDDDSPEVKSTSLTEEIVDTEEPESESDLDLDEEALAEELDAEFNALEQYEEEVSANNDDAPEDL